MLRRVILIAPILFVLAACAAFQASAEQVTPQQTAAIEATCTKIMRLHKGESEFDACVSSLKESVTYQVRDDIANVAYRDCGQSGLKRNSAEFSRCVLDHENAQRDAGKASSGAASRLDAAYVTPADADPRNYFETNNAIRHRREQYSCAQLGLEPDTSAFSTCVANLDMDIFTTEHPTG